MKSAASPVSFRLAERDLSVIDRAARLRGRTRTEFVRDAAVRAAEQAVFDATVIRLSSEAFAAFEAHLADPGDPPETLRALMRRPDPWDSVADA